MKNFETSKVMLFLILLTYFVAVVAGTFAILKILMDYPEYAIQGLQSYFVFVGSATATVIGFYVWKAKAENAIKLPKMMDKNAIDKMEKIKDYISNI